MSDVPQPDPFPERDLTRYRRHLVLPEVGIEGQRRLRSARVLLVGVGGLGSPAAMYLTAAGVGRLGLIDDDAVDLTNLQRQILFGTSDVGRSKLEVAAARLADLNPDVTLEKHPLRLDAANATELLRGYDVVVDGSDNFPTRYAVNDAAVILGRPVVHGSIFRFEGQVSLYGADGGPCYRCLFPEPPPPGSVPSCAEGGVLGVLPGLVGAIQATETIKWILGRGETLRGRLLLVDALEMRFRELAVERDPACPVCGDRPTIDRPVAYGPTCASPSPAAGAVAGITPRDLHRRLEQPDAPLLLDVRTEQEWAVCRLPGARLIPLPELEARIGELPRDRPLVVYCHVGIRSAMAANLLRRHGREAVSNLVGGIHAWAAEVDPTMPRY